MNLHKITKMSSVSVKCNSTKTEKRRAEINDTDLKSAQCDSINSKQDVSDCDCL